MGIKSLEGGLCLDDEIWLCFNATRVYFFGSQLPFAHPHAAKGGFDNVNLFSIITILSFFILTPIALIVEGTPFTPAALTAAGITNHALLFKRALLAGICFHAYQQVSYMILQRVTPVTHSIGNCVKRVVVIVASVFVFQNPVTPQNALGKVSLCVGAVEMDFCPENCHSFYLVCIGNLLTLE